jgi:hypothetical protein
VPALIVLLGLVLATTAVGTAQVRSPRFDGPDRLLLATSALAILGDWLTTIDLARRGASERNPLLGAHPSVGRVNTLLGLAMVGHVAVASQLSPSARKVYLGAVTVIETRMVLHNRRAGLRFNWAF